MSSLSQAIAQRTSVDWRERFGAAQWTALAATVRTAFIDTAACIVAGRDEEATRVVSAWAGGQGRSGRSSLLFGAGRADSATAALVNGVAGHVLDYDDVGLAGHPSVVLVPALLAEHEAGGMSASALVQAYAKGYATWAELQRRVRVPLHARGWHPSAVFGVIAATAAVASLRRLDRAQTAHALGIAASFASGVIANFGSMTKPLHLGRAAQGGIQAVELAQAGLDASADALDGPTGLLAALAGPGQADLQGACADDFESTLLRIRPGIKKYPVCYAAHRSIDGVLDLLARHRFGPSDVEGVDAAISATTAGVLRQHAPVNVTEARFSLEFVLAAAITRGAVGMAEVSAGVLADPATRALMGRVRTHTVDTSCPIEPSFALEDRVTVTLRDGTVLDSGPIRFARGHAEMPLGDEDLRAKLVSCAGPALAAEIEQRIAAALAGA